jgi:hypothetical protein
VSKYKAEWKPNSKNEAFWDEVMVGRKITKVVWTEDRITGLILDSGEEVFLHHLNEHKDCVVMIKD